MTPLSLDIPSLTADLTEGFYLAWKLALQRNLTGEAYTCDADALTTEYCLRLLQSSVDSPLSFFDKVLFAGLCNDIIHSTDELLSHTL